MAKKRQKKDCKSGIIYSGSLEEWEVISCYEI